MTTKVALMLPMTLLIIRDTAMTTAFFASVHAHTPNVTILDSRGLAIHQLAWRRMEADSPAELLITRHRYSAAGKLTQSIDPRLSAAREQDSATPEDIAFKHVEKASLALH